MNFKTTKLSVITTKEILDDSWDSRDESVYVAYELLMAHFEDYLKEQEDYIPFGDDVIWLATKENLMYRMNNYLSQTLNKVNLYQSTKLDHSEKDEEYIYKSEKNIRHYEYNKGKVYSPKHEEKLAREKKWEKEREAKERAKHKEQQRLMRIKEQAEENAYDRLRYEQQAKEHEIQSMFVHPRFNK